MEIDEISNQLQKLLDEMEAPDGLNTAEKVNEEVEYTPDEVAKHAKKAIEELKAVIDLVDDDEAIAKLEDASEALRNMVPELQ